ncbi:hypothetical protein TWF788_000434 [Orbilia oligospora]|uniref:Uncharacterized protein n=2 Tax=Orbilia oligospora TaxID=2813651 RepID=A0A6G1MM93_ORBOL|nr:hypothetical protein TWF788_000434 [Orbilia oligospora]KAF3263560.1 hypothetical protein TWF192_005839 [Orbilia oligospora]
MSSESIDYYEVLGISPNATRDEIRKAYKMKALQTHPDRVPVNHPERPSRTRQFQLVNDAYYTLSDPTRRRDYDATRVHRRGSGPSYEREWQDEQFGEFFEEMMDQEGLRNEVREGTGKFWSLLGAIAGAILGYILYDFSGLLAGLLVGNRLGAVRDKKGKSVYEVFQEMPQNEKMRILSQLAARVLSGMTS